MKEQFICYMDTKSVDFRTLINLTDGPDIGLFVKLTGVSLKERTSNFKTLEINEATLYIYYITW